MKAYETTQKYTENKVLAYCRKHTMLREGDKVVLGVSGGADSICLLFVLLSLKDLLGIRLYVAHVNHGVREDAAEDAAYVEALCREHDIPFFLEKIQMEELAAQLGVSSEEAGRIARYQAFDKACELYGCNKIAVAHNSNDRAETMLFNLFRGTGLKGLAGIAPVRERIVRPLLCLEREEIECYLEKCGILYKQDSTNATDDYTRNRIRHHILTFAQENVAQASIANMNRAADIFAEEESYLEEQTLAAKDACVVLRNGEAAFGEGFACGEQFDFSEQREGLGTDCICEATEENGGISQEKAGDAEVRKDGSGVKFEISVEKFMQQHPVIRKRLLLLLLKQLSPRQQDITAGHIEDIHSLFLQDGNRQIHLPYGIRGERSYTSVWLTRQSENAEQMQTRFSQDIILPGESGAGCQVGIAIAEESEAGYQAGAALPGESGAGYQVGIAIAEESEAGYQAGVALPGESGAGYQAGTTIAGESGADCQADIVRPEESGEEYLTGHGHTVTLPDGSKMIFTVLENHLKAGEIQGFSENRYTKWFDYDKIVESLQVRTRQTGDYLTIRGKDAMQHKSLKSYMVAEKIPKGKRDSIPLLADGDHILWAVGYRISEHYKITENTTRILQVQFKQCEKDAL